MNAVTSPAKRVSAARNRSALARIDQPVVPRQEQLRRIELIRRQLSGDGPVGVAYRQLIKAGCDASWLETKVCTIATRSPWTKRKQRFTKKDIERVKEIASTLRSLGGEIYSYLRVVQYSYDFWPLPAGKLPSLLEDLAESLDNSTTTAGGWEIFNSYQGINDVIGRVRAETGRPHYEPVATLLSVAYQRTISADEIKAISTRRRVNGKGNGSHLK